MMEMIDDLIMQNVNIEKKTRKNNYKNCTKTKLYFVCVFMNCNLKAAQKEKEKQ